LLPVSLDHQPDVYHRNSFHLLLLSLVSLQNSGDENRIHVFLLVVTLPSGSLSEVRPWSFPDSIWFSRLVSWKTLLSDLFSDALEVISMCSNISISATNLL
jgi:hypothetical protein